MRSCAIAVAASLSAFAAAQNSSSPIVDLGYELHQGEFNTSTQTYSFSNIRYAAPPTGANRFSPPQPPASNRSVVQTSDFDRVCPQASPAWELIAAEFIPEFLKGQTDFNTSSFSLTKKIPEIAAIINGSVTLSAEVLRTLNFSSLLGGTAFASALTNPDSTEDCLFLDVVVPEKIFNNQTNSTSGAPVMVWVYGGGYTEGSKADGTDPAGLIARSQQNGSSDGVIFVAMNYRLGALGWLSGPTFQQSGAPNAGLLDQRFALEWVQQNIAKFGGDPKRVTVFGESAGGGSVMHQVTAYGGSNGSAPFQQAILQSPGFQPVYSKDEEEQTFQTFLGLLNVTTLDEARRLPSLAIQTANLIQVGVAQYGTYAFGPSVDGGFVPGLPAQLLFNGSYDKDLKIMVGHNADEGLLFTSPFIQSNDDFAASLSKLLPDLPTTALNYIASDIYPPVFDGSQNYTSNIARFALAISDVTFTCNTFYLDKAFGNQTYAYEFSIPPALHGQDVPYTFAAVEPTNAYVTIAEALQSYLTAFAMNGNPNEPGVPYFNLYGANATLENLNITGIVPMLDPVANARCDWWQQALPPTNQTANLTLGSATQNANGTSTGSGSSSSASSKPKKGAASEVKPSYVGFAIMAVVFGCAQMML